MPDQIAIVLLCLAHQQIDSIEHKTVPAIVRVNGDHHPDSRRNSGVETKQHVLHRSSPTVSSRRVDIEQKLRRFHEVEKRVERAVVSQTEARDLRRRSRSMKAELLIQTAKLRHFHRLWFLQRDRRRDLVVGSYLKIRDQ